MTEGFAITSEMLAPVKDTVMSGLTVALPIGIGIFAVIMGINYAKKAIKKWSN